MSIRRRRERSLGQMFKLYVAPSISGVTTYQEDEEAHRRRPQPLELSRLNITARSFASVPRFAVTHEQQLYPSVDTSKEILTNNRNTYRDMTNTLKQLEWASYRRQFKSVAEQKHKLSFFKYRARRSIERPRIRFLLTQRSRW